jgi:hypothetical protein
MAYVGQTRSARLIADLQALGWGEMTQPNEYPPRRRPWVADNGAFKQWRAGVPFDSAAYAAHAERIARDGSAPDFVVVPDVVADGEASMRLSLEWAPRLRGLAPLYFVVQNGMEPERVADVLEPFAGLFVGGDIAWKLATAPAWGALAHAHGRKCHIGRVGSFKRVQLAKVAMADSIDSCVPLFSRANLNNFARGLSTPAQLGFPWKEAAR